MKRRSQKTVLKGSRDANSNKGKQSETDWNRVWMASLISFLSSLQTTQLEVIQYPYMKQVDPDTSVTFSGSVTSLYQASFLVSSLVFCCWSYRTKQFRIQLLTGRIISLFGLVLYLCVELLLKEGRYLMRTCYSIFGVADGANSVLRTYSYLFAAPEHSGSDTYAVVTGHLMGLLLGRVSTAAFSSASLLFSNFLIDAYTCPIWTALIINILSLSLIFFMFKEFNVREAKIEFVNEFSWERVRNGFASFRSFHLSYYYCYNRFCCWLVTVVLKLHFATCMILTAPTFMTLFGWSGEETVIYLSVVVIITMILHLCVRHQINTRCGRGTGATRVVLCIALAALLLILIGSFVLVDICAPQNNDHGHCENGKIPVVGIYTLMFVLTMGVVIPLVREDVDRHYSLLLPDDQPIIYGWMTFSRDLTPVLGSLYVSFLYSTSAPFNIWLINAAINVVTICFMLPFFISICSFSSLDPTDIIMEQLFHVLEVLSSKETK